MKKQQDAKKEEKHKNKDKHNKQQDYTNAIVDLGQKKVIKQDKE